MVQQKPDRTSGATRAIATVLAQHSEVLADLVLADLPHEHPDNREAYRWALIEAAKAPYIAQAVVEFVLDLVSDDAACVMDEEVAALRARFRAKAQS